MSASLTMCTAEAMVVCILRERCAGMASDFRDIRQLTESLRDLDDGNGVLTYARLSILRVAYYTIMMRAAQEIGPGLTGESRIDTALAYMA